MSDNRYRILVMTYSWAECKAPRINSCHVVESPKKMTLRVKYKFNHRSSIFAFYVLLPAEKYDLEYRDEPFYEIDGGPNSWGFKHRYPNTEFFALGHHAFVIDEDLLIDEEDHI
jgi:hypothetical protein